MKLRNKVKLYHVSLGITYKPGDIIHPNITEEYLGGIGIYCSGSPTKHFTLDSFGDRSVGKKRHNVYQVIPLNSSIKVEHGEHWDELIVRGPVQVVKCLGEVNKNKAISYTNKNFKTKDLIKTRQEIKNFDFQDENLLLDDISCKFVYKLRKIL